MVLTFLDSADSSEVTSTSLTRFHGLWLPARELCCSWTALVSLNRAWKMGPGATLTPDRFARSCREEGIQAQTISVHGIAFDNELVLVPVMNKVRSFSFHLLSRSLLLT